MTDPAAVAQAGVRGRCDERFAVLAGILRRAVEDGYETGASVAVVVDGEPVVDIWAGYADPARQTPWARDTVVNVWSLTKLMVALCALVLADRSELNLDATVATYWPEFAANGKSDVLVRHLLSHTSGVPAWDPPVAVQDLYDTEASTARLARQEPWWRPGTRSGYHAPSQGHLVGEIIRRITAQPLATFFAHEIAGPSGADFQIGLAPGDFPRAASVIPSPPLPAAAQAQLTDIARRTLNGPAIDPSVTVTPGWRGADIGALNGHGNARSLALIQSVVASGGRLGDRDLLKRETVLKIFERQSSGVDLVLGVPVSFGLGYALPHEHFPYVPPGRVCFWGGWGGSLLVADLDRSVCIAYAGNKMHRSIIGSRTSIETVRQVYQVLLPALPQAPPRKDSIR